MRLLTLDIDGVMMTYRHCPGQIKFRTMGPPHVQALNAILDATDPQIVMISCWCAEFDGVVEASEWLAKQGINKAYNLVGLGPYVGNRTGCVYQSLERMELAPDNLCIIEDESIEHPLSMHHIQPANGVFGDGLQMEHVPRALELLTEVPYVDVW